jgi:peptide/nickel transport system permease protein
VSRYITSRLLLAVLQIIMVATLVFSFLHLLPGDPVLVILGPERNPTPEVIQSVRAQLGLDKPILFQYVNWLRGIARLDLGNSLANKKPVWQELSDRIPRTIELILVAMSIAITVGIPMGIISALKRGKWIDQIISTMAAFCISVPVYVVGTLLVLFIGVKLDLLPIAGYKPLSAGIWPHLEKLILPSIVLSFGPLATIARMTRSSMLDVLYQNYMITAKSKGLTDSRVLYRHGFRNALIPVITLIGIQIGSLLGGAVLVEYIFNWPGLSTLLVVAINRRDYPMVQGVVLVISFFFVLINLAADLLYSVIDPRIRFS